MLTPNLEARLLQVSARGGPSEAIRYAFGRWNGLTSFLDEGRIDLETNTVEPSSRPTSSIRKYALFAGSREAGDNWAVIATLIDDCKLSGINPHGWLTRTLFALANSHAAKHLADLMP